MPVPDSQTQRTDRNSLFAVPKMDCPSEENLIRMALDDLEGVARLSFDLEGRRLIVLHSGRAEAILRRLEPLHLGATLLESNESAGEGASTGRAADDAAEGRTLKLLLGINAAMFVLEMVLGLIAQSTGLIADSLDMFADAAVYGLALYAVGRAAAMKIRAAHLAGWLQLLLALGALAEVARRFVSGSEPDSLLMGAVGLLALAANVACLVIVAPRREMGAHMKASYIFSANDVIANLGVIAAGILVALTESRYPDLVIGAVIGAVVLNGARRILKLR